MLRTRPTLPLRGRGSGAQRSEHPQAAHPCPAASAGVPGAAPPVRRAMRQPRAIRPLSTTLIVNNTDRFSPRDHRPARRLIERLTRTAAHFLPHERVSGCGRRCKAGTVSISVMDGRAAVHGTFTCGSVWLCPRCADKIARGRARELRELADRHCRQGGVVWMGTFTLRHDRWQSAAELRRIITKAWSKTIAGAPWQRASAAAKLDGWARALEVTHGNANGWHPHIHAVFFLGAGADAQAFGHWLFDRWCNTVERLEHDSFTRKHSRSFGSSLCIPAG